MQLEYKERIIVYLRAEFIDDSCQVFARNSPVGAAALHFKVRQAVTFGNVQQLGIQFPVQQLRDDHRLARDGFDQFLYFGVEKGRHNDGNVIRFGPATLHLGFDGVGVYGNAGNGTIAGIIIKNLILRSGFLGAIVCHIPYRVGELVRTPFETW